VRDQCSEVERCYIQPLQIVQEKSHAGAPVGEHSRKTHLESFCTSCGAGPRRAVWPIISSSSGTRLTIADHSGERIDHEESPRPSSFSLCVRSERKDVWKACPRVA